FVVRKLKTSMSWGTSVSPVADRLTTLDSGGTGCEVDEDCAIAGTDPSPTRRTATGSTREMAWEMPPIRYFSVMNHLGDLARLGTPRNCSLRRMRSSTERR